jgi:hypothetical protein
MQKFVIEVQVQSGDKLAWLALRPTGGPPYTFDSEGAATDMARRLYAPEHRDRVRVAPAPGGL